MELTSNKNMGTIVRERRLMPRFHLLTRVDVSMAGSGDTYWGSLSNISRTGAALAVRQNLKPGQRVTIGFHFQSEGGREVTETLTAKVIWRSGDNMGLEFETPLTSASPALVKARYLAERLAEKEAGR